LNIKGLAHKTGLNYNTAYKYLKVLEKEGLITSRKTANGIEFDDSAVDMLREFANMIKGGLTTPQALEKLKGHDSDLQLVLRKIEALERENQQLRELVQMYLSRIDNLEKALTPPKRSWLSKLFHRKK
jgi:DNA-binding transcriptional regulator YhcF (GntR family)